ncbi:MAG: MopE-related protein [Kofleriaceae bacterium]
MSATGRLGVALAATLAAAAASSCDVNDYCLNCAVQDGAHGGDGGGLPDGFDPGDGGPRPDACVVGSIEICDGADNDCDGEIDEDAQTVGEACGDPDPPCSVGVWECTAGELTCSGVAPTAERCDDVDNDCDGTVDEGDPGGGATCGTDVGECVSGITRCAAGGVLECQGAIGTVGGVMETCDGRDNDCDGVFDEGLPSLGPCPGGTDVGECVAGELTCVSGVVTCTGRINPTFELCDVGGLDQDCDGDPNNGYDLDEDARNCGACGNVCDLPNAIEGCDLGACVVVGCETDYWDINPAIAGCEYGPCEFQGSQEACNLADDDCDGIVDEGVVAPANLCRSVGACATMTTTTCTATGWDCVYGNPDVSVDASGDLQPETACDGIDNDCDGRIDESHPQKGTACNDGGLGECRGFGTRICDPGDPEGPVICEITDPGLTPPGVVETCNGLDDDCDGIVDNGYDVGALAEWVTIAGGVQIMKYEASRPDAASTNQGSMTGWACSKAGVLPWTNVTQPVAEATCAAMGARLCSESEWELSCLAGNSTTPPAPPGAPTYPVAGPTGAADYVIIEAEHYQARSPGTLSGGDVNTWEFDSAPPEFFSGAGAMQVQDNDGGSIACNTTDLETRSPRLDYQINFTQAADYYVWVRMWADTSNDDDICVGISTNGGAANAASHTELDVANDRWQWIRSAAINVPAVGNRFVSVYMRDDGVFADAIAITRDGTNPPNYPNPTVYGVWGYGTNPTTPQPTTCNVDDYDTDPVAAGDQDGILPTGSLASCFANGPGTNDAFDMSGNVKEWTAERAPGANPQRGGASNNEVYGSTCTLDFTLANDTFFFPNVGFRCCR